MSDMEMRRVPLCKTRCPRGNTPCYIIQALRTSIEDYFVESEQGEDSLQSETLEIIFCNMVIVFISTSNDMFPEQGNMEMAQGEQCSSQDLDNTTKRKRSSQEKLLRSLKDKYFDETGGTAEWTVECSKRWQNVKG